MKEQEKLLSVTVSRCEDGGFIAEAPEFNISVFANSRQEVVDDLKLVLTEDYQAFMEDHPDNLTEGAKKLFSRYCDFFKDGRIEIKVLEVK